MSKCSKLFFEGGEKTVSASPASHPSEKLIRTSNQNFWGTLHSGTFQYSQGIPASSLVLSYPTRHPHAQLALTILHETQTFKVCTTVWRVQLQRHASCPAWHTSNHPRKADCERHVGIPWSKRVVSGSLDEPLSLTPRQCHQDKRRKRLKMCWVFPA